MKYLNISHKSDYAIVQLDRGKVNALNHEMVEEIREAFRDLKKNDQVRGVIITGKSGIFSAGLDLIELYEYDREKMDDFFISFGSMHVELATFPKPLVAAINGHSPAGGTVIAITADYRIMAEGEKYSIGLNEVAVNIQVSQNLVNAYAFWIGTGKAHQYILEGKLLNTKEAFSSGLVNEVCEGAEVLARAEQQMQHYMKADQEILINTKAKLRKAWWDHINSDINEDLKAARRIWWRPDVRAKMKAYIEYFTSRKAKA